MPEATKTRSMISILSVRLFLGIMFIYANIDRNQVQNHEKENRAASPIGKTCA